MINQAAKRILKALSFDGVEVDAFRHMADLKRLDPMKIFYKKIDEKYIMEVMQYRFVSFSLMKSAFRKVMTKPVTAEKRSYFCLSTVAAG